MKGDVMTVYLVIVSRYGFERVFATCWTFREIERAKARIASPDVFVRIEEAQQLPLF